MMTDIRQSDCHNLILSRLSPSDFGLLSGFIVKTTCSRGAIICEADTVIPHILFPETSVISIVVHSRDAQTAEGGLVGREGFVTAAVLMGVDRSPLRTEVQIAGDGYRLEVADFLGAVAQSDSLRLTLLKFAQSLAVQTAYTAMSNAAHPIDERLARWLLMCHDRSSSDDLALTHRFMSVMLAVRRATVTTALQTLEANGFIKAERGYIMIVQRAALEEFAGDAYGGPEAEYERLLGPMQR